MCASPNSNSERKASSSSTGPATRCVDGRREVLDVVRRRWVALTPEEWVRQQVIHYLHDQLKYPLELMQVEGQISVNGQVRRCDIVVYNKAVQPAMVVECKQLGVAITQKVADQACRYNMTLRVPYIFLTNGRQHWVGRVYADEQRLEALPSVPTWQELNV